MTRAMMRPDTESPGGGPAASRNPEPTMTTLLTEQETAALLRISVKGLQSWRYRGGGPKFLSWGGPCDTGAETSRTFCSRPCGPRLQTQAQAGSPVPYSLRLATTCARTRVVRPPTTL